MVSHDNTIMNTTQIAALAKEIATAHAFEYAGNFGRGTFRYQVSVEHRGDALYLAAACNAQISEARAKEELAKVWGELAQRVGDEALAQYVYAKSNGYKLWRYGFWNMGRFCTSGFRRGLRAKKAA